MLSGATTRFYETLRWPDWPAEVAAVRLDQGLHTFPPPSTAEGSDLSAVSRRPVPLDQLVTLRPDLGP
jgi:hypothetical protein